MEGNNTKRLANVLSDRMKATSSAAVPVTIELGVYNRDGSISPYSLRGAQIPKGQYLINWSLVGGLYTEPETLNISGGGHGGHDGGSGTHSHTNEHSHRLPPRFNLLAPGDYILIAWCGTEPVVICRVTSS